MAQRRLINFGDTVQASRVNSIITSIVSPGVLEGAELSVGLGTNAVNIAPSKVMLNELLLIEDNTNTLLIDPLPSDPTDYTIIYEHINQQVLGGVPADLLLKKGLFGFDDLENSVVLGWIRHPGSNAPLTVEMFIEAPKLKIENPSKFISDVKIPPLVPTLYVSSETPDPGSIQVTDEFDLPNLKVFVQLENTSAAINSIVQLVPFVAGIEPPDRILLEANSELGSAVTAALVAEDGTVYAAENATITNTSSLFEFREILVPLVDKTKFAQNRPYFVQLTTQLNPGKKVLVSLVGTTSNPLPF